MLILELVLLFVVKVIDNILNTTKSIMIQRNRPAVAGCVVVLSQIIYFTVVKQVVTQGGVLPIITVALAAGIGTYSAVKLGNRYSKEKLYVHIILSNNKEEMMRLRDYLAEKRIPCSASNGYTLDWEETLQVTVYAETRYASKVVDDYLETNNLKAKRIIQK